MGKIIIKILLIFCLLYLTKFQCYSQLGDFNKKEKRYFNTKSLIAPSVLIAAGLFATTGTFKNSVQHNIQNSIFCKRSKVDDYIQYAPIVELYTFDLIGLKSKNSVFDHTKYLIITELLTFGVVRSIKLATDVDRPNTDYYSFPSGHTTQSFASATVLYNEFKDTNIYLASSGYLFSSLTGVYRMINNKHWVSDVLFGAGLGVLIANFVYYWAPLKNWNPFKKSRLKAMSVSSFNGGARLAIAFKL